MNVQLLKDLIEMGFSPMVALVVIGLVVLWSALCAVAMFLYRQSGKERDLRDQLREAWKAEIDSRLRASEEKHEACDKDRDRLHNDLREVRDRVARFERCPKAAECPMRLP